MVEPVAAVRHRRIPVVGIFGYYSSANWGDDVMGRLFAQLVRDAGGEVRLFTTNPDAAYFAGIATARDPAAFVDASDLVVYGGGGLLATKHDDASPFAQAIDAIVNAAQKSSTPVHALSVGGGGQPGSALPGFVRRLLSAADRVTVRNRSDLETVRDFNRGAEWYQDVLWLTPSHYRLPASPVGRLTVAVNLSGVASRRRKSVCKQLFRVIGRFRTDIEFVFINSQKVLRKPPIADSERVLASPEADFALINAIDLPSSVLALLWNSINPSFPGNSK